jgi:hypothetical protein
MRFFLLFFIWVFDVTDGMEVQRESDPPASPPGPQSEPTGEKMKEERKRKKERSFISSTQHMLDIISWGNYRHILAKWLKCIRASKLIQSYIREASAG